MPMRRVEMRQVREILRLSLEPGLSTRVVGERVGIGPTTVRDTLKRFARAGLSWPVPPEISDAELEGRLYGLVAVKARPSQAGRAGLVGGGPGVEAQTCDASGSLGGVYSRAKLQAKICQLTIENDFFARRLGK